MNFKKNAIALTHYSLVLLIYTSRFSDVLGGIDKQHRAVMGLAIQEDLGS